MQQDISNVISLNDYKERKTAQVNAELAAQVAKDINALGLGSLDLIVNSSAVTSEMISDFLKEIEELKKDGVLTLVK
jgi:nanoRNase/pAp phosphatase (c-di-AMP/oligoRNAs hydrolase)